VVLSITPPQPVFELSVFNTNSGSLNREITIKEFAQIVGKLVAAEPGVEYAPIYIKSLEIEKDRKLKESNGNFEYKMIISNESVKILSWWINSKKFICNFLSSYNQNPLFSMWYYRSHLPNQFLNYKFLILIQGLYELTV
jgi:hypothetical protein